ncbi:hypothetical protein HDU92_007081 [Lobulomyces angularis]|nr:hypothetical protein HDU92_007081 [Lobulomyces angularis]
MNAIPRHIRFDTNILITVVLGLGSELTKGTVNVEDNLEDIWSEVFNLKEKPFKSRSGMVFSGSIETDGISKNRKGKKRKKSDDTPNVEDNLEDIWSELFNLKEKPFKSRSGMVFSGSIETDGISVTVCLEDIPSHNKKKNRKGKKRKKSDDTPIIENKKQQKVKPKSKKKPSEYFQDNILKDNHVYIDPNKRDLLYCLGANETFGDSENTTVLIGDWSRSAMKYQVPTKGKGFRDMFKKAGYQKHLKKDSILICHGLLRCKNENYKQMMNGQLVERLWNRDDVATLNIKDVVMNTLLHKVRPVYLRR